MPNWCNNFVQIRHEDPAKLEALAESVREGKFCNYAIPVPKELTETVAGHLGDGYAQELNQFKLELNLKYFGAKDWYDFCISRWGTKWEVEAYEGENVKVENELLAFGFDSAWSPPTGIYEALVEQGFNVDAMYYESGMAFCGRWTDGCDNYFELSNLSADEVADEIDSDIDEQFSISENMREWEENREDEELTEWIKDGVEKRNLETL